MKIKYIDLEQNKVTLENLEKCITNKTKVISIAGITNVVGDLRPIKEITEMASAYQMEVDKMTVDELPAYLTKNWEQIKKQLLTGKYKPSPVRRVEIPKLDGGMRQLGIPTVLDRFIQQAVVRFLVRYMSRHFRRRVLDLGLTEVHKMPLSNPRNTFKRVGSMSLILIWRSFSTGFSTTSL